MLSIFITTTHSLSLLLTLYQTHGKVCGSFRWPGSRIELAQPLGASSGRAGESSERLFVCKGRNTTMRVFMLHGSWIAAVPVHPPSVRQQACSAGGLTTAQAKLDRTVEAKSGLPQRGIFRRLGALGRQHGEAVLVLMEPQVERPAASRRCLSTSSNKSASGDGGGWHVRAGAGRRAAPFLPACHRQCSVEALLVDFVGAGMDVVEHQQLATPRLDCNPQPRLSRRRWWQRWRQPHKNNEAHRKERMKTRCIASFTVVLAHRTSRVSPPSLRSQRGSETSEFNHLTVSQKSHEI